MTERRLSHCLRAITASPVFPFHNIQYRCTRACRGARLPGYPCRVGGCTYSAEAKGDGNRARRPRPWEMLTFTLLFRFRPLEGDHSTL
jgi:hypothetical protein